MPAVYRLLKQIGYGALYVVLATLLISGVVILIRRAYVQPTPPPAAALPSPLRIEQVEAVRHGKTVDLVARLRNPNTEFGIRSVTGTFHLITDDGTELATHNEKTYLLPGMIQYLVALDVPSPGSFAKVELTLSEPITATIPSTLILPSFAAFPRERTQFKTGDRLLEKQTGILRNTSNLNWERIEVIGVALDERDTVVGVSKTFLGALDSDPQNGDPQLEFSLQWPAPARPTSRVIIWPTTNIFEETNIIKVIGNPNSLR